MMDWNPDPHSLFTVNAGTGIGILALRAACRARYAASCDVYDSTHVYIYVHRERLDE